MREMWQLPRRSIRARVWQILKAATVLWAVIALPVTVWLAVRTEPTPPPPPQRQLTVVEVAAVRYASQALLTRPVSLEFTTVSPLSQLRIKQTVDPVRAVSFGVVHSGSQKADLVTVGGKVLLRGGPTFWSSLGVLTTEPGWVEVGDRLGTSLVFPLTKAAAALTPGPKALMDDIPEGAGNATFRNGSLAAVFGGSGVTSLSYSGQTAAVGQPAGGELTKLAGSPPPEVRGATATLIGTGGALTVTPPPPPMEGEATDVAGNPLPQ